VPAHHGARQALAGVLLDARQQDEAMRVLREGLQLAPSQFGFAMMLARLQVERGELDAGVQTLSRSAEYAGNSAEYAAFYAGLLQRQQRHAEAVEFFDRALRLRPNVGIWLLGMGMSLDVLGRGAEAQEAFRRAKASGNLPADLQSYADQRLR
jgi:MSHA biogenesis protein MshN